jgi:CPA2 family monovalent cation:H+ antiporter-2
MDVIFTVVCLGLLTVALLSAGQYFRIPSSVCFLIIGILAGPYALSIVTAQTTIETIGEIGVILLLFAVGLQFSLKKLLGAWRVGVPGSPSRWQQLLSLLPASSITTLPPEMNLQAGDCLVLYASDVSIQKLPLLICGWDNGPAGW